MIGGVEADDLGDLLSGGEDDLTMSESERSTAMAYKVRQAVFDTLDEHGPEMSTKELRKSCERALGVPQGTLKADNLKEQMKESEREWGSQQFLPGLNKTNDFASSSPSFSSFASYPSSSSTSASSSAPRSSSAATAASSSSSSSSSSSFSSSSGHPISHAHSIPTEVRKRKRLANHDDDDDFADVGDENEEEEEQEEQEDGAPVNVNSMSVKKPAKRGEKTPLMHSSKPSGGVVGAAKAVASGGSVKKKGKFSDEESEIIRNHVQAYLTINNLDPSDIAIGLKEDEVVVMGGNKRGEHKDLWDSLMTLLPGRGDRNGIRTHARRLLMKPRQRPWSDAEKEQLRTLVLQHGRKWSVIGRMINRINDDCKNAYERFNAKRTNTGKFSAAEDSELFDAVVQACGARTIAALKAFKPSWSAISAACGNKRSDLDYLRRWPSTLARHIHGMEANGEGDAAPIVLADNLQDDGNAIKRPTHQQKMDIHMGILTEVINSGVQDETAVDWPEIDRRLGLYHGCCRKKMRLIFKDAVAALDLPAGSTFQRGMSALREQYQQGEGIAPKKKRKVKRKDEDVSGGSDET